MAKRRIHLLVCLAASSFVLTPATGSRAQSAYSLSFNGPGSLFGVAGTDQSGDYVCILRPSGGGAGVQGYSFGVTAVEGTITGGSLVGTDAEALLNPNPDDRFVYIQLTSGLGNDGIVFVVQLDEVNPVTLPADVPSTLAS